LPKRIVKCSDSGILPVTRPILSVVDKSIVSRHANRFAGLKCPFILRKYSLN
jgi:hypothetical protein